MFSKKKVIVTHRSVRPLVRACVTLFPSIYSKTPWPRNFKLGTQDPLVGGQNPIDFEAAILDFKVTEVKKVTDGFRSFSPQPSCVGMSNLVHREYWMGDRTLLILGRPS